MKLIPSLLAFALAIPLCGCIHIETGKSRSNSDSGGGDHPGDYRFATELTSQGGIGTDVRELEVVNRYGKLRIVGSDSGPWSWTSTIRIKARDSAAGNLVVESATVTSTTNGSAVRIEFNPPSPGRHASVQSDLEVRVPRHVLVHASNEFGPMEVEGFTADVSARSSNGKMTLEDIGGAVTAEASFGSLRVQRTGPAKLTNRNGSIEALDIRGSLDAKTGFAPLKAESIRGPARLKNANGSIQVSDAAELEAGTSFAPIEVRNISGRTSLENRNGGIAASELHGPVIADTSFAPLRLDTDGPAITARNQNGGIHIRARSTALTNLVAETSFATLEVRLPSGLNPRIEAHSDFGKVESDFPVTGKPPGGSDVAAGEPRIQLNDRNGTIRVLRD
ncbi:MAG: hypothetical protein JNL10_13650 [Verrucomicrobiales bacterium]|nr:hypothetical protein [Verrucomicrobiales bacterium]